MTRRGGPRRAFRRLRGTRSDRGTMAIELMLYTPILMLVVFIAVQFALYYLGSQVVSSTAREAARVVRTGGTVAQAQAAANDYAKRVGSGLIGKVVVTVPKVTADGVRVEVTAEPLHLVNIPQLERVTAAVEGPIERFRPDGP